MPTPVARATVATGTIGTSIGLTIGTGGTAGATAAGSTLVIAVSHGGATVQQVTSITDSAGNTWSALTTGGLNAGEPLTIEGWICQNALSIANGGTVTINHSSLGRRTARLIEVPGVRAASLDKNVGQNATTSGTAMTTPSSGVLAQADEIVLCFYVWDTAAVTSSVSAPWTKFADLDGNQAGTHSLSSGEWQETAATTAVTGAQTLSTSSPWTGFMVTLKVGAATPTWVPKIMG